MVAAPLTLLALTLTGQVAEARADTPVLGEDSPRVWLVAPREAPSGRTVLLQGFVVDANGRPASPLPALAVSVERGTLGPIQTKEDGAFEVAYTAPESGSPVAVSVYTLDAPERPFTLQLGPVPPAEEAPTVSDAGEVPALQETPWRRAVGLFLVGHNNLAASRGFGLRLEGSQRLGGLPLEALVQLEGRRNQEERQPLWEEGEVSVDKAFTLQGFGARLGARWSQPLWSRGVLFADATVGLLRMTGTVRLVGLEGTPEQQLGSLGPQLALGGGLGWRLGGGFLCGQVQWAYAPGQGLVRGNLGGLSLALGYQFSLGGGVGP